MGSFSVSASPQPREEDIPSTLLSKAVLLPSLSWEVGEGSLGE